MRKPILRKLTYLLACSVVAACVGPKGQEPVTPNDTLLALPQSSFVSVGDTVQLGAARLKNGESTNVTGQAAWTTANAGVATVDATGAVTATGVGETTITADYDGFQGVATIVVSGRVASVEIENAIIDIAKGTNYALSTVMVTEDNKKRELDGGAWGTTDAAIATVDQTGLVTGVAPGSTVITLVREGQTSSRVVNILDVELESVAFEAVRGTTLPVTLLTPVGVTGTFTGGYTQDVTDLFEFSAPVPESEEEAPIVETDGPVVFAGEAAGAVTVTATGVEGSIAEGKTATLDFTVTDTPVSAITLAEVPTQAVQHGAFRVGARGTFGDITFTVRPRWSAEPAELVYINRDGSIEPLAAGTVTLTAELGEEDALVTASVMVTISDAAPSALAIDNETEDGSNTLEVGAVVQYSATVAYGEAMLDATDEVVWESSNPDAVTVSNALSGLVTARAVTLEPVVLTAHFRTLPDVSVMIDVIPAVVVP